MYFNVTVFQCGVYLEATVTNYSADEDFKSKTRNDDVMDLTSQQCVQ